MINTASTDPTPLPRQKNYKYLIMAVFVAVLAINIVLFFQYRSLLKQKADLDNYNTTSEEGFDLFQAETDSETQGHFVDIAKMKDQGLSLWELRDENAPKEDGKVITFAAKPKYDLAVVEKTQMTPEIARFVFGFL